MRCQGIVHIRGLCAVASLSLVLQGCASLYLHSSEMETATQAAKDDLTKINIDKTFADAKAKLDAFTVEEDAGTAAYLVAERNQVVANLVRANLIEAPKEPAKTLSNLVKERATVIVKTQDIESVLLDNQVADLPDNLERDRAHVDINRRFAMQALKDFRAHAAEKDPRPTDCDKTPGVMPAVTPQSSEADIDYARLVRSCMDLNKATVQLAVRRKILRESSNSPLAEAVQKIAAAKASITSQTTAAKELTDAIKKLQAEQASSVKDLDAQIKKIREMLSQAKGIAAVAGADEISKVLEQLLAADLSAKPAADALPPSNLTKGTLAVLKLTKALAEADDAFSSQSQVVRVNSTLLAIAEQRQKLDMAQLTVEEESTKLQIYSAEEMALIREIALLSRTYRIYNKTLKGIAFPDGFASVGFANSQARQATGAALAGFVDSWNQGRIPYRMLVFREVQVERAYIVKRASKTAKNWVAVLSPPLDDLVAYGKGGIHPETIATIITNLGIIGAILAR